MKGNDINHNCLTCNDNFSLGIINNNKKFNCYENCSYYYYFDSEDNYYCTDNSECPQEYDKLQIDRKQCIKDCSKEEITKYEFQHKCYEDCPPKSEKSLEKVFYCEAVCDEDNPFKLIETQECVNFCDINKILSGLCIMKYKDNETTEIKLQDKFLDNIDRGFTSENYNTSGLDSGKEDIIQYNKITFTLTTTENQKNNNDYKNITSIDFRECESILRKIYKIPDDNKIYMKKIDIKQEGMKIPKIEYDIYYKLNGKKLVELNLSYCANTKIDLYVPVNLTENLDFLNTTSGYFNDICYTATSENGTDITLNDRKNEFVTNNKTVCQENCDFANYDYDIQKAKCHCYVKESSNSSAFMVININEILNSFKDIKNIANVVILQCYNVLFSKNGIKRNYGFYIIIPFLIFHFICIFMFYLKQLNDIKGKISNIVYGIKKWYLVKKEERKKRKLELERINEEKLRKKNEENNKLSKLTRKLKKRRNIISTENEDFSQKEKKHEKRKDNIIKIINPFDYYYLQQHPELNPNDMEYNPPKKKKMGTIMIQNNIGYLDINYKRRNNQSIKSRNEIVNKTKNKEIIIKVKEIMAFNDNELNDMEYKLALKYDNRTYLEYYCSLIKTKNNFIFSFFYNNDYNSKIIKIDLFFIGFTIDFTVNALFFNDNTMHKIYEDKGKFQFMYQLPQIIYSSIISIIFNTLLKLLALSENDILTLKSKKEKKDLNKK